MILHVKEYMKRERIQTKFSNNLLKKKATNKLKIVEVAETENLTKSIKDEVDHFSNNSTND